MKLTRIGGPSVLVEHAGWRILIDPTFDPPGRRYAFALGTSSVKTLPPAIEPEALGPIDVVLVSHDHHADNLDDRGRALLPTAGTVVTTAPGAGRLGLPNARGLRPGESILLESAGKDALEVTATPARHGPPLSRAIVGAVIGFLIRRPPRPRYDLWATGDTVLTRRLRAFARGLDVDTAIVNAGGVGFPLTGPIRYTMTGADAVTLIGELRPRVAIPAHFDGWSHFRDGETGMRDGIRAAPSAVRDRIRWLPDGTAVDLTDPTTAHAERND
ncbi:MBL fold metallo-hydrolase [Microbacterium trichothecenolyticum]|uniref:MBL fold metallo-hydrolase n=1 Tax=Microbacterium ureisolvens TaxID=2781186 RepID=A0ABS7I2B8_9MICO|nr:MULTISPECIES: MBL fold metallo-hydrolase [Microbacterium]MBW9111806.1 MBL fold metallo-hydrolase [Microbacterium ureisolvens]MBW9122464.1 MBL fold metallo-hydrolase [Microbacterium trichothecenolyticum]